MFHRTTSAIAIAAALAAAACSSNKDGDSSSGNGTGSGGAGGAPATTSTSSSDGGGFSSVTGGGGSMGCLEESAEAAVSPLDMIVLLDRSISMAGSLWTGSTGALGAFFQNPGGTDMSAAINYFPAPGTAPGCQPSSYNPPSVPIVAIPADATTLINDMQSQSPTGNDSPIWAALYGTLQYANDYQDQNPDHVVVVVLASDGDPTACNTNVSDIAALTATAFAYNGVRTYVVAIQGAIFANLDQIAAAGGTVQALDVTNDITQFQQKMDEIRKDVLACEYTIPAPMGQDFDPLKLNVKYTPGGGAPEDIPQAASAADCGNGPGWYYDNPNAPTKVIFCPATCALIQADGEAKVDFVFGCPTIVN